MYSFENDIMHWNHIIEGHNLKTPDTILNRIAMS